METSNKSNLGILLFPWASNAPYNFASELINIFTPLTDSIFLISSNENRIYHNNINFINIKISVHYVRIRNPIIISYLSWILKFILIQIIMAYNVIKVKNKVDTFICMSYPYNLLSIILIKLFRKNLIILALGSPSKSLKRDGDSLSRNLLSSLLHSLEKINFTISDRIIVESKSLINFLNLENYGNKVFSTGSRYIDTTNFYPIKKYKERKNLVGYIGRLEEGKGILDFYEAIKLIIKDDKKIKFLIAGSGSLYNEINDDINLNCLKDRITLLNWISHDQMPNKLSELKLYVLSSYSEGLPTTILESMACGTPVLCTPVGGIADIIEDNVTGFILSERNPEYISDKIIDIMENAKLDEISYNSKQKIKSIFTYAKCVERWKTIIKFNNYYR